MTLSRSSPDRSSRLAEVGALLRQRVDENGEEAAVRCATGVISWSTLAHQVQRRMDEAQLGWGQRVGLAIETSLPAMVEVLAVLAAGATPVLAHPRWPREQIERAFRTAGLQKEQFTPLLVEGQPATVLFTSGSTNKAKAVVHATTAHLEAARASAKRTPFRAGDAWLLSLPICHIGGLSILFRSLISGGSMIVPDTGQAWMDALIQARPTHVSLVATQLFDALKSEQTLSALRAAKVILLGGGPVPKELWNRANRAGLAVQQTYGSTETGSQIATQPPPPFGNKVGGQGGGQGFNVGRALPGTEVRVSGTGEIEVRAATLFVGYLDASLGHDDWERPASDGGWWPTGDYGELDAGGILEVKGRVGVRFISGGENVAPEQIENVLLSQSGVRAAAVVEVPDVRLGARPFAFVDTEALSLLEIEEATRPLLAPFQRPAGFAHLPKSQGLKPSRSELRSLANKVYQSEPTHLEAAAAPGETECASDRGHER